MRRLGALGYMGRADRIVEPLILEARYSVTWDLLQYYWTAKRQQTQQLHQAEHPLLFEIRQLGIPTRGAMLAYRHRAILRLAACRVPDPTPSTPAYGRSSPMRMRLCSRQLSLRIMLSILHLIAALCLSDPYSRDTRQP